MFDAALGVVGLCLRLFPPLNSAAEVAQYLIVYAG